MKKLQRLLGRIPLVEALYGVYTRQVFRGSVSYWEKRYKAGGNSGAGSYHTLALYKAEVLNDFIRAHNIRSVIEFGCGDGNQLTLLQLPRYIGLDVSRAALEGCIRRFKSDRRKSFFLYDPRFFLDNSRLFCADLSLSLDVIFHLVEDDVYHAYMRDLFSAAERFVVVYSSNEDKPGKVAHIRHRRFTDWVRQEASEWSLTAKIDNRFPFDPRRPDETSFADFYVFQRNHPGN